MGRGWFAPSHSLSPPTRCSCPERVDASGRLIYRKSRIKMKSTINSENAPCPHHPGRVPGEGAWDPEGEDSDVLSTGAKATVGAPAVRVAQIVETLFVLATTSLWALFGARRCLACLSYSDYRIVESLLCWALGGRHRSRNRVSICHYPRQPDLGRGGAAGTAIAERLRGGTGSATSASSEAEGAAPGSVTPAPAFGGGRSGCSSGRAGPTR